MDSAISPLRRRNRCNANLPLGFRLTAAPRARRLANLLALAAASSALSAVQATAATFGYTTVYSSSQSSTNNIQIATKVTLSAAGTVTSISAYVGGSSNGVRYAIYADNNGEPGSLKVQSNASNTSSSMGWKTISVSSTYLPAGTYWLALSLDSSSHAYRYSSSGGTTRVKNYDAEQYGYPNSWGSSNSSNSRRISIYATYTPQPAQTYYVRKSGSNSNNGKSKSAAWLTISKAAQTMQPGDTVYVGAGTYLEQVAPSYSGTSGNMITYVADATGVHTGDAGTVTISASNQDVLLLSSRNYTEFEGFVVYASGTSGRAARWQNSTGGVLQSCILASAANDAVSLSEGSLTINACGLMYSAGDGIDLDSNGQLTMTGCVLNNNGGYGVNANNSGCTVNINRCQIYSNSSHGIYVNGGTGTIKNCLICYNSSGIYVENTGAAGLNIWNCTNVSNSGDGIFMALGTINVRNCILANNSDDGLDRNGGTFNHSYNLCYGNGTNFEGVTKASSELDVNPTFAGPTDWRLLAGSPAINAGVSASGTVDDDLNDNARPVGPSWDLGCYEEPVSPPTYDDLVDGYSSNGPLVWWRLNEDNGASVADDEMDLVDGVYQGATAGVSAVQFGATNKAASFDGVNDYINFGNGSLSGSAITILAWFNADDFDEPYARILSKAVGVNEQDQFFTLGTTDSGGNMRLLFRLRTNNATTTLTATSGNLTAGAWHFAAAVYDGSTMKLYLDGTEVGSVAKTGSMNTSSSAYIWMGNNPPTSTNRPFDGLIDEVAVYAKALTQQQISAIYDASFDGIYRGLVGHWKLDEGAGTFLADSSGRGNNATQSGATWTQSGKIDGGLDFNGTSAYASAANATTLQITSAITISAWIRGDSWDSGTDANTIVRKGTDNPNNYQLAIADGRVALMLDTGDDSGYRGNTVLQTGQWYHVAATWDGSEVRVYLNGALDHAAPYARAGTIATDTRPLYIGGRPGTDFFDGILDDVRLYNRALSEEEIQSLMYPGGSGGGLRVLKWVEVQ